MTAVSWWGHKVDNAYWVWSFQGKLLKRFQLDRFCQFSWRPRPPCFLNGKQIRDIKKNLKKYSVEFDVVDKMKISEISKELLEKRQAARKKFDDYRKIRMDEMAAQKEQRMALRNGIDTDGYQVDDQELEEEVVEFLVSEEISTVDWNNSKLSKIYDNLYDFALIMYWCQGNKQFLSLLDTIVSSFF